MHGGAATPRPAPCGSRRTLWPRPGPRRVRAWCDGSISSPAHVAHAGLNRRSVRLFKTTDKLDHAIAALASTGESSQPVKGRSEEHTSELQSQSNLVCRLLL